jgi:phage recombination protein Bet
MSDLTPYRPPALSPADADPPLDLIRAQIAPKASDGELALFAMVCDRLEMDPFKDQIYLIGRWDAQAGREIFRPQISVLGRAAIAHRTGLLTGIEGPWFAPKRTTKDDGSRGEWDWEDVWDWDGPPYAAKAQVWRAGSPTPYVFTALWSEFVQKKKDGEIYMMWRKMPANMLGKCAVSGALRRAFPESIGGVIGAVDAAVASGDITQVERVAATIRQDAPPPALEAPVPNPPPPSRTLEERVRAFREAVAAAGGERAAIRSIVKEATGGRTEESAELTEDDLPHVTAAYASWKAAQDAATEPEESGE